MSAAASAPRSISMPRRRSSPGPRQAGPADQMDGRAQRDLPLRRPGPRPRHPCRAGARQGRQVPGDAGRDARQYRRLSLDLRAGGADLSLRDAARRQLHDAGDLCRGEGASSPTPRRSTPIAAPGGPRRPIVVERLVDTAAREMKIDPAELRRRNFIAKDAFPYQTPVALAYDSGDYFTTLDMALKAADYAGFEQRRAGSGQARQAARHRLRHLYRGLRHGALGGRRRARRARRPLRDRPRCACNPTGSVTVFTGSHSHGQGHETTFAQLVVRPARHADREDRGRPRRHRQDPVRHGHLRLALAAGRRHGDGQGDRQDRRQGQEDRRASARGGRGRHRVRGRQVHGRRHRPRKCRSAQVAFAAYVPHNYPHRRARARPRRDRLLRSDELHLSRRHAYLRGRDRPRHRRRSRSSTSPAPTISAASSIR